HARLSRPAVTDRPRALRQLRMPPPETRLQGLPCLHTRQGAVTDRPQRLPPVAPAVPRMRAPPPQPRTLAVPALSGAAPGVRRDLPGEEETQGRSPCQRLP